MRKIIIAIIAGLLAIIGIALVISTLFVFVPDLSIFSNSIAVIAVKGEIVTDSGSFSAGPSAMEIVELLEDAENDASVSAILIEINSPGGSVVGSRQVVEKIRQIDKPVVAWISDIGASGGYYVAAASDHIVADNDSITGSIGVVSIFPNIEQLLEDLGIEVTVLKEGKHKTMGSMFRDMSEEERAIMQTILHNAFVRFKQDIREFRSDRLNVAKFEQYADGRILSGEQALQAGMIDQIGTKRDALDKTAELAGLDTYRVADYKKEISLFDLLSASGYNFGAGFKTGLTEASQPGIKS